MFSRAIVSDEHLIQRIQQGDLDSFNTLYERHQPRVRNRVRYVVPEADVEDVTQEVFIAALKSLRTFRGESLFSTWLRALTNYKVAEYYRKRSRKRDPRESPIQEAELLPEESYGPTMEDRIALRKALVALPEKYQEVILMRFAEGMQFDEIAQTTNSNLEAVKSAFRRAIAALRKAMDEQHAPH